LRWSGGFLEVGQGRTIGQNRFMSHQNPSLTDPIRAVGLSTGWGSVGSFFISNFDGINFLSCLLYFYSLTSSYLDDVYTVFTEDTDGEQKERFVTFPHGRMFDFKIRACKEAILHLVTTPYSTTSEGYR
jgi:hypothetical protein